MQIPSFQIVIVGLVLWCTGLAVAQAQTLTVGGTGSSAPLVQLLFDEFRKQSPQVLLRQVSPPLGSGGAIRALKGGHVDLAVTGRALTAEESSGVGPQFEMARTPLVFVTPDGQRAGGFTLEDLANVYTGSLRQWDHGQPIRLVLRAAFESDTLLIRAMSPKLAQADTTARKRPGMQIGDDDLHTLHLLSKTPAALGTTTLGLMRTTGSSLRVLPINGVKPSLANMQHGNYPWYKVLVVVLAPNASASATGFAQFLRSGAAKSLLERNDYAVVEVK